MASGSLDSDATDQKQSQQSLLYMNNGENNGSPDINKTFDQRQKIRERNRVKQQRKAKYQTNINIYKQKLRHTQYGALQAVKPILQHVRLVREANASANKE